MQIRRKVVLIIGLILLVATITAIGLRLVKHKGATPLGQNTPVYAGFQLSSSVFKDGAAIPVKYTCKGENINPPLHVTGPPANAKSFALILHDPDAVSGDFVHWTLWNIDRSTESIDEGHPPADAVEGANGTDKSGYIGPCPPSGTGTHHYIFDLYALDTTLNIPTNSSVKTLRTAMTGHEVAHTKLTGLFAAE